MSEWGWSDSELAFGWLERYNDETKEKANGLWWLVYYDGHETHITLKFIDYALTNKILLVCLPPHTSHALQPFDIGVCSPFKQVLSDEAYAYEMATGQPVDKDAALLVIGKVYAKAVTKTNIQSAFRCTGIWPFSHDAIKICMTAPSASASLTVDAPVPMPTIVKKVVCAFEDLPPIPMPNLLELPEPAQMPTYSLNSKPPKPALSPMTIQAQKCATATWEALSESPLDHLATDMPATSSDVSPPIIICPKLPLQKPDFSILKDDCDYNALSKAQLIEENRKLRLELDLSRHQATELTSTVLTYQASLVLSGIHNKKQQQQLRACEEKHHQKNANGIIKPDVSKGCIISSQEAQEYELAREKEKVEKEAAKEAQKNQQQEKQEARCVTWHKCAVTFGYDIVNKCINCVL